jgi:hypothetical protein
MYIFVSARLQATAAPDAPAPMISTSTGSIGCAPESQVRTGLAAGGKEIRTVGPAVRGFKNLWKEVAHPELGRSFVYPGEAAIYNGSPWRISRRAPLIGEHNVEIFCTELGLSRS